MCVTCKLVKMGDKMQTNNSAKTVVSVFFIGLIIIAGFALIGLLMMSFFFGISFFPGFASAFLLTGLIGMVWRYQISWNNSGKAGIAIVCFAFLGMCLDAAGNEIYNYPLEWFFSDENSRLLVETNVEQYGATTAVNYDFVFVNLMGEKIKSLSMWFIMPFRYIEYWLIGALIVTIATLFKSFLRSSRFQQSE